MKKIILLMLVAILAFTFVGCGNETIEDTSAKDRNKDNVIVEKTEEEIKIEADNNVILPKLAIYKSIVNEIEDLITENGEEELYVEEIRKLKSDYDKIEADHKEIIGLGGYLTGTKEFEAVVDGEIVAMNAMLEEIKAIYVEVDEKSVIVDMLLANTNELIDIVNEVSLIAEKSEWFEVEEFKTDLKNLYVYLDELTLSLQNTGYIDVDYIEENIEKTSEAIFIWSNLLKQMQEEIAG